MPSNYRFTTVDENLTARNAEAQLREKIASEIIDARICHILKDLAIANGWDEVKVVRSGAEWYMKRANHNLARAELDLTISIGTDIETDQAIILEDKLYKITIIQTNYDFEGFMKDNFTKLQKVLADEFAINVNL